MTHSPAETIAKGGKLHAFLVLGRMSNLPTVWSNVTLAWILTGARSLWELAGLLVAGSLMYTGGMFLNDYFDVKFDTAHRPERPIPSGQIRLAEVGTWGAVMMAIGWLAIALHGFIPALYATVLTGVILLYNKWHKGNPLSPWIMAGCRIFLIFSAAAAFNPEKAVPSSNVLWSAVAVGSYIVGLTYIAKAESAPVKTKSAYGEALFLLALPWLITAMQSSRGEFNQMFWIAATASTAWLIFVLAPVIRRKNLNIGKMVSGLLAGIPLIDALVLSPYLHLPPQLQHLNIQYSSISLLGSFMIMYVLALLTQKIAPAT